jgi:hypothetical protein
MKIKKILGGAEIATVQLGKLLQMLKRSEIGISGVMLVPTTEILIAAIGTIYLDNLKIVSEVYQISAHEIRPVIILIEIFLGFLCCSDSFYHFYFLFEHQNSEQKYGLYPQPTI